MERCPHDSQQPSCGWESAAYIACAAKQTWPVCRSHPLAAINANGDSSVAATSASSVAVGAPLPPTVTAVVGSVGQLAVEWSAPAINADLGVTYTLTITDVTAGRSPATAALQGLALSGSPIAFTGLVAGTKRVQIKASNANTATYSVVVQSALSDEVDVTLSTAPGIATTNGVVGSDTGATITVTAPSSMSTSVLSKFLIQVGARPAGCTAGSSARGLLLLAPATGTCTCHTCKLRLCVRSKLRLFCLRPFCLF